ncbi:unnamed protein product, partial [Staurois parvus]
DENLIYVKVEVKDEEDEELYVKEDGLSQEEEIPPEISTDPRVTRDTQTDVKAEEEEIGSVGIKEEETPTETGTDGQYKSKNLENLPTLDGEIEDDIIYDSLEENPVAPNLYQVHHREGPQTDTTTQVESVPHPHLVIHLTAHRESETFLSSECGKYFSQRADLTSHQQGHEGEKPYSCFECSKCFSQKNSNSLDTRKFTQPRSRFHVQNVGNVFLRGLISTHIR